MNVFSGLRPLLRLGTSIYALGGVNRLTIYQDKQGNSHRYEDHMAKLRDRTNFAAEALDLEVLAALRPHTATLALEHELGLSKDQAKPDAHIRWLSGGGEIDVEIKLANMPLFEKTMFSVGNQLEESLTELTGKGAWEIDIYLGNPKNSASFVEAEKTAAKILAGAKGSSFDFKEGGVRVRGKRGRKSKRGTLVDYRGLGVYDRRHKSYRIARNCIQKSLPKIRSQYPLVLIIRPWDTPVEEDMLRHWMKTVVLPCAHRNDKRVRNISEIWFAYPNEGQGMKAKPFFSAR